ncbi:thioredoxin H2-like [Nymphaea colorata]|nr:thioredoxin H2-like [Nymphaea colorata]
MGSFLSSPAPSSEGQHQSDAILFIHSVADWKSHFDSVKASNKLLVVDFSASWCGPCRFIEPAVHEFAQKYTNVSFVKIDVDELQSVASELGIQAMPTFLLFKGGNQVDKVVGAKKDELEKKILSHMG